MKSASSYFVVGTDTNVGKTYIATALVKHFARQGLRTLGMKPVASGGVANPDGVLRNEDALALINAANVTADYDLINPYCFSAAIAPHLAAESIGVTIDLNVIETAYQQLQALSEVVIVEGAGGLFVPLNEKQTLADLAVRLNLPIVLVVGMRLGCINHALLTVEAIQSRGLKLAGWVANQIDPDMPKFEENIVSLQQRISAPCLSVVHWQGEVKLDAI